MLPSPIEAHVYKVRGTLFQCWHSIGTVLVLFFKMTFPSLSWLPVQCTCLSTLQVWLTDLSFLKYTQLWSHQSELKFQPLTAWLSTLRMKKENLSKKYEHCKKEEQVKMLKVKYLWLYFGRCCMWSFVLCKYFVPHVMERMHNNSAFR